MVASRQFAQRGVTVDFFGRQHPHRHQQTERDRQIEMAAFLQQVGGREVDRDAFGREAQTQGAQRRAHPFARFGHRLVGQADDIEMAAARPGHRDLDVDVEHVDPLKGDGGDPRNHMRTHPN